MYMHEVCMHVCLCVWVHMDVHACGGPGLKLGIFLSNIYLNIETEPLHRFSQPGQPVCSRGPMSPESWDCLWTTTPPGLCRSWGWELQSSGWQMFYSLALPRLGVS